MFLAYLGFASLTAAAFAQSEQSDEEKAKAFFKNNLQQSAEDYVTSRIEQSLSERFRNVLIWMARIRGFQSSPCSRFMTMQKPVAPLSIQGGIIATDDDDTLNLGLGQRWILNDGKVIAGLNLFYDNEWDAGHERMSVGGEILSETLGLTAIRLCQTPKQ